MKIFPIDPELFILIYAIIIFIAPWLIAMFKNIKCLIFIFKEFKNKDISILFFPFYVMEEGWKIILGTRKSLNLEEEKIFKGLRKWVIITLVCWVLGFVLLGFILFILDSKGLFMRDF